MFELSLNLKFFCISSTSKPQSTIKNNDIKNENESDIEYYEKQLNHKNELETKIPEHHSDQAKMILELFNGKYMD